MGTTCLDVHPVYGAIYQDGEFVQRGAVLGLSVDSKTVVIAPISGWVRLLGEAPEPEIGLRIEIMQNAERDAAITPVSH